MKKTLYILFLLTVVFSCKEKEQELQNNDYVAKVGEEYLYKKDIAQIIKNYNNDSSSVAKELINNWVIEQLTKSNR